MQSSYRIAKILGISVELHISFIFVFFLALFIAAFYGFAEYQGFQGLLYGTFYGIKVTALFLLLFGTVLIHEFAHSIVALKNGINVPRITLTPIGGAANIDVPENPVLEFKMSIIGPLTNFIIFFLSLATLLVFWPDFISTANFLDYIYLDRIFEDILIVPNIFAIMITMNFLLGAFNLIPAFPMDGGRILRSVLAFRLDYISATSMAVKIGQIFAVLMFIAGLSFSFILIIISIFIFISGPNELRVVKMKHILHGMTIGSIAVPQIKHVNESATILEFLNLVADPRQDHYPVTQEDGKLIGMLNMNDLREVNRNDFYKIRVNDVARRDFDIIDANLKIEDKLPILLTKEFILVVESKRVVGYLTPDHLMEIARFYSIRRNP